MRSANFSWRLILLLPAVLVTIYSCNKETSATGSTGNSENPVTTSNSSTIAVASDSTGSDSVYILQQCDRGFFRDSIASSSLPDSVLNFLSGNYPGYVFQNAYVIKDSAGTTGGFVVIIRFNGKPVGLLFDASGKLERVLEQRERGDLENGGWHKGGRFDFRDGKHRDTIAIASLPSSISSYMATNYPSDTLVKAYLYRDSSILVISRNDGVFATVFNSSGTFVKRVSLTPAGFLVSLPLIQVVAQDSLPATASNYLASMYPNFVFESALSITLNGVLKGYNVVIDANDTKYAVWFDANGNFLAVQTIW